MTTDIRTAAFTWLLQHNNLCRRRALDRCTAYLVSTHEVSRDTAARVAVQALAELESRNQQARIDTAATTAHVVIVHRPNGLPLAFTVNDLLRLHSITFDLQPPATNTASARVH